MTHRTREEGTDFIREKIFPGGHLPCLAEIRRACRVGRTELSSTVTYCNSWFQDSKWEAENVASHLREDSFRTSLRECSAPFSLGQSYAETLNEWRRRFELHETQSFCWQVGLVVVVGLDSCWVSENGFWSSFAALLFLFVTKIMFHLEKDGKGMSWNVLNMSKTSYTNSLLRRFHFRTWFFCTSLVAVLWSSLLLWLSNWRPGSLMYNHCRIIYIERDTYLSTPNMRIQYDTMMLYLNHPNLWLFNQHKDIRLVWIDDLQVWCFHAWMWVAGFAIACRLRICSLIDRSSGEGFTDRFLRRRWWWCGANLLNQTDHDGTSRNAESYSCLLASLYASRFDVAHLLYSRRQKMSATCKSTFGCPDT